jgi:hypothetical protein
MRISGKKNNHDSSDKLDPKSVDWRSLPNTIRRISRIGEQPSGLFSRPNMAVPLRGMSVGVSSIKGKNENPVQNFDSGLESSWCDPSGLWLAAVWPAESLSAEAEAKAATYTTFDHTGSTYIQPQAINPAEAVTGTTVTQAAFNTASCGPPPTQMNDTEGFGGSD